MTTKIVKKSIILLLILGIGVAGYLVVKNFYLQKPSAAQTAKAKYSCPMHPNYVSDRPGDCPICGMKLIKVEQEKPAEGQNLESICVEHDCTMMKEGKPCPMLIIGKPGEKVFCPECGEIAIGPELKPGEKPKDITGYAAVVISQQRQQLIGVKTVPVEFKDLKKTIRATGRIAYDPELYQTEEEYIQAIKALEKAKGGNNEGLISQSSRLVDSGKMKLRLLGLSDELIDEIAQTGAPDKTLLLSGADQNVWMYATVYEYELGFIKIGQNVLVRAEAAGPNKSFAGIIRSIDPVIDPQTRSARIRAVLDNKEGILKPNMYVTAEINIGLGKKLVVPDDAVLDSGERQVAFVDVGKGLFQPRSLKLGLKSENYYEVISGLKEGEKVISGATFFVDSESRLKAAVGETGNHKHGE